MFSKNYWYQNITVHLLSNGVGTANTHVSEKPCLHTACCAVWFHPNQVFVGPTPATLHNILVLKIIQLSRVLRKISVPTLEIKPPKRVNFSFTQR
jgi:hypothetical protein